MKTHHTRKILSAVVGGGIAIITTLAPRAGADTPSNPGEVNLVGKEQYTRHTLTGTDGRKLEGDIISISKTDPETATVKFKRKSDSKEFDIPLAKLSADDRGYLLAEDGNLREIASLPEAKQYGAEEKFLAVLDKTDPQVAFAQIRYKTMAVQFLFDRETIAKNTPRPVSAQPALAGHKTVGSLDTLATVQPKPRGQKEDVSLRAFLDKHDIRPYKERPPIPSTDPGRQQYRPTTWGSYDDSLQIFHFLLQYHNAKEKLPIVTINEMHDYAMTLPPGGERTTFRGSNETGDVFHYGSVMSDIYDYYHKQTGKTLCEASSGLTSNLSIELAKHELRNGRPVTSAVAFPNTKDGPGFNVIVIGFHTAAGETISTQGEKTTFDIIKLKSKSMFQSAKVTTKDYLPGQTRNEMSFETVNAKQLKGVTAFRFEK